MLVRSSGGHGVLLPSGIYFFFGRSTTRLVIVVVVARGGDGGDCGGGGKFSACSCGSFSPLPPVWIVHEQVAVCRRVAGVEVEFVVDDDERGGPLGEELGSVGGALFDDDEEATFVVVGLVACEVVDDGSHQQRCDATLPVSSSDTHIRDDD